MSRSRVHMLMIGAAKVRSLKPGLADSLEAAAREQAERRAEGADFDELRGALEEKRIEHQRTLFNALPSSAHTDRRREAMIQRAYDLMWEGFCTECDVLVEFLPSDLVEEMFAAWESDSMGRKPRSRFYDGGDR